MEQSPYWEANSTISYSRNSLYFMKPEGYRDHTSPPPDPKLSQINPIHKLNIPKTHFINILFCNLRLGFPSGLFHLGVSTKIL
jgi:hypothetical protein